MINTRFIRVPRALKSFREPGKLEEQSRIRLEVNQRKLQLSGADAELQPNQEGCRAGFRGVGGMSSAVSALLCASPQRPMRCKANSVEGSWEVVIRSTNCGNDGND